MFKLGLALTIVWVLFGLAVLGTRYAEWLPLFGADDKHLALNAIGDTLAGFFAPLAFLWLFIATWLQRQELSLQRKELADTREVLDAQMEELKRSANESNMQTEIMNQTLFATIGRDVYESFSLNLYYLARSFASERNRVYFIAISYQAQSRMNISIEIGQPEIITDTQILADHAYSEVLNQIIRIDKNYSFMLDSSNIAWKDLNLLGRERLATFLGKLESIVDSYGKKKNSVINSRIQGLELLLTIELGRTIIAKIDEVYTADHEQRN